MKITVRCFASVRELFGQDVLEREVPAGTTLEGLKNLLAEEAPDLLRLPLAQAVNLQYAKPERELQDGDEVAFIPPISGGDHEQPDCRFTLVDGPLDPRGLEDEARTDHDGAIVTFLGVTRDHNEGQAVKGLSYECYAEMATKVMDGLMADIAQKHDCGRIRVAHRLGEVPIGEASVIVVIASAHRGPAFEACRELMDRLKAEVPIFKREFLEGPDGETRWVGDLPQAD